MTAHELQGQSQLPDQSQGRAVLLSGASGMIGSALAEALRQRNVEPLRLTRIEPKSANDLVWNPGPGGGIKDLKRLEGIGAAVHLSGANVSAQRWTEAYRRKMIESRVETTRTLSHALAGLQRPPRVLVVASAVGYYGDRGDELLDESSAQGEGFFPELCAAWEGAGKPASDAGIRVVHLRFGIVIGRGPDGKPGGALERMAPLFRLGLGGRLGDGRQWMSWISEADVVRATLFAIEKDALTGGVNVVSPEPVTNAEFTRAMGEAVHRPAVMPAPASVLRLVFGQMADEALLASTRVVPRRLLDAGFTFTYPHLGGALAAAL